MGAVLSSTRDIVPLSTKDRDLHVAASKGYLDLCRTLVRFGANVKAVDSRGRTALHHAVASDSPDVIKYLIEAGCDTDIADHERKTALDLAVEACELNAACALDAVNARMDERHPKLGWIELQPWSTRCLHGPWNRDREFVPGKFRDREAARSLVRLLHTSGHLPNEITDSILDFAEFWQRSSVFRGGSEIVTNDAVPYLQTTPLDKPINRVSFKIWSHDQGWSDYPEDEGTYRNSSSWFEAAKRVNGDLVRGPVILTNRHAIWDPSLFIITWSINDSDEDDPTGEKRKWVQDLKPGDCIALVACARYPGWENHTNCAEIVTYSKF